MNSIGTCLRIILIIAAAIAIIAVSTINNASNNASAQNQKAHSDIRSRGSETAKITLIEYASFTCPHCGHFHETVLPALAPYIENGDLLYIYRDFPLDGTALGASMLAECVGRNDNDKYFKFIDLLYRQQKHWASAETPAEVKEKLFALVSLTGMNETQAETCLKDQSLYDAVIAERRAGEALGVNATPWVLINNERQKNTSTGAIRKRIEALLKP